MSEVINYTADQVTGLAKDKATEIAARMVRSSQDGHFDERSATELRRIALIAKAAKYVDVPGRKDFITYLSLL